MGNKDRGSGTHGRGFGKKGRGAGHRGGRGKTGGQKHEKYPQRKFGKKGFKRPQGVVEEKEVINVGELDQMADYLVESGLASTDEDGNISIDAGDLGIDKVLGSGKVTKPIRVKASDFSSSAEKKIEEAGGGVEKQDE